MITDIKELVEELRCRNEWQAADIIEVQKAEIERLKEEIYEAINNEEDRIDYQCKCRNCVVTLTSIGNGLRKALGGDAS